MKKNYLLLLLFLLASQFLLGQIRNITGRITDASTNEPIAGATVKVKSSNLATSTNANGSFSISALPNDVLQINYLGYTPQTIALGGREEISVKLIRSAERLREVVLVGTRSAGRVKLETTAPVDVVNMASATLSTGRADVTSLLNVAAPSFNYNKQSGSDGADHIDLATLRGLGPDQTLVLINGKRRHQTAFVSVFGTRGRGNSGTDLSAIPVAAIDRVEILRDGASAQYGSDAIAGVINIILKQDVNELTVNTGYSGYYDPKFNSNSNRANGQYPHAGKIDGNTFNFDGNFGVRVGKNEGFINLTGNYLTNGKTYRQSLNGELPVNVVRRAFGEGSLQGGGGFINAAVPFSGTKTSFYAFGGYNYKNSEAYAFSRNFSARPDRFPTDASGNLIPVPGVIHSTPDGENYFNPLIQTRIQDASAALGIKGAWGNGWTWDVSNTTGYNDFKFFGDRTFNASLGATQTHFDDGGFTFLQNTSNLNFSKQYPHVAAGMNVALGAEYRYERYKIQAGEPASYLNYDPTGEKATGSQGFPGYQPNDEVTDHRSVVGGYLDLETDLSPKLLTDVALRLEHYSDFGSTFNARFATRYKAAKNFNLRGSVSTGFRAPSLQQINYSSTFTTVQGSVFAEVKIAPNYSPITQAAGIPTLKQEKSVNGSLGFTYQPLSSLSFTLDGYWVRIKDRVVLSGQFSADDPTLDPAFTTTLQNLNVGLAQFFANAVNTTNKGIDLVVDFHKTAGDNRYKAILSGNIQDMTIDDINYPARLSGTELSRQTFLSDREQKFILASAPDSKFGLNLEYGYRKLTGGTRFTYYGRVKILGYGEDGLGINPMVPSDADPTVLLPDSYNYQGKVVSDLYLSYRFLPKGNISIGADNVFNVHPDLGYVRGAAGWAFNNEPGGPFDAVQMGSNGTRLFAKLGLSF